MKPQPDTQPLLDLIVPALSRYSPEDRWIFTALAERIAATRYRAWAELVEDPGDRETLLACAAREEDIASRVEALRDDAHELQAKMRDAHPELPAGYAALFEALPLRDQFALQAAAEGLGAGTWASYAAACDDPAKAEVLRACGPLEEASAAALQGIIAKLDAS